MAMAIFIKPYNHVMTKGYYIGIMSGTSLDGIDAGLFCLTEKTIELTACHQLKFPKDLHAQLVDLITHGVIAIKTLGELDHQLGKLYGEAALAVCKKAELDKTAITAIGCHGQSIYHQPEGQHRFTLQIGDPNIIAAKTGIPTVADFRRMDMAFGGQGAPLVPAFHQAYFADATEKRAIVNIGGIANITFLDAKNEYPIGFDVGPGNTLMDLWIQKHLGQAFDDKGEWAQSGQINQMLLRQFLKDPYFKKSPPKSTGKEYFNLNWLELSLTGLNETAVNIQATLLALTVEIIAQCILQYPDKIDSLYLCGGGAYNRALQQQLAERLMIKVATTNKLGISPQWVEAAAFAYLAKNRLLQQPVLLKQVTGASENTYLGGIYQA